MKSYVFIDHISAQDINPEGFDDNRWQFVFFLEKDFRINKPLQQLKRQLQAQCKLFQASKASEDYLEDLMKLKLGEFHQKAHRNSSFVIISHSKAYDNLISIIKKEGRVCMRLLEPSYKNIASALNLDEKETVEIVNEKAFSDEAITIIRNLKTITPVRRPKTVKKFQNYISNFYKDYEYGEEMTTMLYEELISKEAISQKGERIKYLMI
ncbi:hypothetical protein V6R21_15250 [Limibacter armeniacum]|uniref:hypothetical protein n=1 Tax=Limibacter armeniacum TaxID=466084 RepID=UPI002FE6B202